MGKIIASAAIMCGVLVLALPITIIVDNFIKVAQDEQQAEQQKLDQVGVFPCNPHPFTDAAVKPNRTRGEWENAALFRTRCGSERAGKVGG